MAKSTTDFLIILSAVLESLLTYGRASQEMTFVKVDCIVLRAQSIVDDGASLVPPYEFKRP